MSKSRKTLFVIVSLVGAAGWYFWSHSNKDNQNVTPPVAISVAPTARKDMPIELKQAGNVIAYETVGVRSRLDSQLVEVKFKDGDKVEKGQLLFVLDDRALKAQESQLIANLQRDRAQLENLRQQYERSQNLTKKGYESASNLDQAKAGFKAQDATVGATEAELQNVRVQLGYTRIMAPISGRTGTINVTVGNTVKANDTTPLVTINQIKPIRVQMALPQTALGSVRDAMQNGSVRVLAEQQGDTPPAEGTLEYIDNAVDQSTGTFVVRAIFANDDETLWPGVFMDFTVLLGTQTGALTVPEEAVQHGQTGDYVFTIENNIAHKKDVVVASNSEGLAVIKEGLNDGETVATDGLMSLKEGTTVTINAPQEKPPEPTAAP